MLAAAAHNLKKKKSFTHSHSLTTLLGIVLRCSSQYENSSLQTAFAFGSLEWDLQYLFSLLCRLLMLNVECRVFHKLLLQNEEKISLNDRLPCDYLDISKDKKHCFCYDWSHLSCILTFIKKTWQITNRWLHVQAKENHKIYTRHRRETQDFFFFFNSEKIFYSKSLFMKIFMFGLWGSFFFF